LKKKKIINDPLYGFITINNDLLFQILEHPYFQRLRRIRQLGLSDYVYPGALHTRFHHALGATHLMHIALDNLRQRGHEISDAEYEAAQVAILLHDIGHGPFSHALEFSLLEGVQHESISYQFMKSLNKQFNGALTLSLEMFRNTYHRKFFHQLISSQLDVDRMDYLNRDSFYTGVSEGNISVERILNLIDVVDDKIVVEEKAIYSLENFLNARRLMYWTVYLHKTALSAEKMLINLMLRAREVETKHGLSPALQTFLRNDFTLSDFQENEHALETFAQLDDYDIWGAIKTWSHHPDKVLSELSTRLLNRDLFRIKLTNEPLRKEEIKQVKSRLKEEMNILNKESRYFFSHGEVTNKAYVLEGENINIKTKSGEIKDISNAADLPNIKAMSKIVKKYYLCMPKNVSL
jgi:HD superfamily phosphohydrolase